MQINQQYFTINKWLADQANEQILEKLTQISGSVEELKSSKAKANEIFRCKLFAYSIVAIGIVARLANVIIV